MDVLQRVKEGIAPYEGKLLVLTKSGSHLYGTATPQSDTDYVGVFVAGEKSYLGFQRVDEVDLSVKSKLENGKNAPDAVDIKVYELRKFLKLAGDCNPNIVELLFADTNEKALEYIHPDFKKISENSEAFVNSRLFDSFFGYAKSQLKKGILKAENYKILKRFLETAENFDGDDSLPVGEAVSSLEEFAEFRNNLVKKGLALGDVSFPRNASLKKVVRMVRERLEAASHRKEEWESRGYDAKFFMHLFRLLDEGMELALTKRLSFPLKNRDFYLKVRNGEFSLEELQELVDEKIEAFRLVENEKSASLPKKANWKRIESLLLEIARKNVCTR